MIFIFITLLSVGVISGFLAGMFGLGGGLTVIPALVFTLTYFAIPTDMIMQVAIGTSLSIMFVNSISSVISHNKVGKINIGIIKIFLPFIVLGAILGSIFASYMPTRILLLLFVIFLGYVIFSKVKKSKVVTNTETGFSYLTILPYGLMTGLISTSVGGGSSLMIVPFLTRRNFSIQQSVAISSVFNVFLALTGTVSYILLGYDKHIANYAVGYVYLPASTLILFGGFIGVPLGVKVIKRINDKFAKQLYFSLITLIFVIMLSKLIAFGYGW